MEQLRGTVSEAIIVTCTIFGSLLVEYTASAVAAGMSRRSVRCELKLVARPERV